MATAALRVLKDLAKKKINGANSTDYHNSASLNGSSRRYLGNEVIIGLGINGLLKKCQRKFIKFWSLMSHV